jgi:integrase
MRRPAPCLWKSRHGIYYFRLVTPKSFKAEHSGVKGEFRCSLKTRCPKEALVKARTMWAAIFGDSSAKTHPKLRELTSHSSPNGPLIPASINFSQEEAESMRFHNRPLVIMVRTPDGESDMADGGFIIDSVAPYLGPRSHQYQPPTVGQIISAAAPEAPPCSELFKLYTDDQRSSACWSIKTMGENAAINALLIRICGDHPITDYGRQHLIYFKQTIQKIPKNLNKDPRFRNRTIAEILRMREIEPLDVLTVNKYLARTCAFFSWCHRNSYIDHNPAEKLGIRSKKHPRDHRDDFTSKELQALLSGDIYQGLRNPLPYRFWLPLLGMYTGARLDELCQLHTEDIRECDGIWCFSFNNEGQKKLKNLSSLRTIPIHSKLIEAGFLRFVDVRRKNGSLRLFPELPWKELDGYQRNASKWFSEYRRRCGISSSKKTFHSFRHTVSNHLKQRGCIAEQVSSLLGHATDSITFDRYGKQYRPEIMRQIVEQIDYGISLEGILDRRVNPYI